MTNDLLKLKDWLEKAGCTHVAIESAGVYWKPVFNLLEDSMEVVLANARDIKNVPGRKTAPTLSVFLFVGTEHCSVPTGFPPARE